MLAWVAMSKIILVSLGALGTIETLIKTGVWKVGSVKEVKGFDLNDPKNRVVMGITRQGKTFATMHSARYFNGAVLFFNTQHEKTPFPFILFDPIKHDKEQLLYLLRNKRKINFLPSVKRVEQEKQLKLLVDIFYEDIPNVEVLCLWDEVHLFKKQGKESLIQLATTGLRWGKYSVFMSQRPALIDNTLLTQSTELIFFRLANNDYSYLETNGYPVNELKAISKDKYVFATYDLMSVKGGFRIKP